MTTTLTGAGNSSEVQKATLVTKEKYNKASIAGWNNPRTPLREMRLGGLKRLGVVFPYNPTLNLQGSVAYGQYDFTHANYQPHFYTATHNQQITLGFNFTASTLEEANYMLGFMHFLRTITKMNFGKGDDLAGMPPPVLEFSCYGDFQFKKVPVVIRNYSYDQTGQEDYVDTSYNTQVPTFLTGFVDVVTNYTPGKVLSEFTLQDFANGKLIKSGKGFI